VAFESDKWSRIGALRPTGGSAAGGIAPPANRRKTNRIVDLLRGELRTNASGEHVVVRRRRRLAAPPPVFPAVMKVFAPSFDDLSLDPRRWLFLDTETTGLAGGTGTYAFLVGIAAWADEELVIEQFFMRDHGEERSMLQALAARIADHPVLVTFNGKSFDWPLLETRYRMTRAATVLCPAVHLDLLHPSRQLWRLRTKSVALGELERHVLGIRRPYDIAADTIPQRYFEYLRTGIPEPVAEVFEHNEMDLYGLAALAANLVRLAGNPECEGSDPLEIFGISRMLQRSGDSPAAVRLYERALSQGLPPEPGRVALRELALIARREGDYARAAELSCQLLGDTRDGLDAYEQLAIHHEHRTRDLRRAASLTREALVRLQEALRSGKVSPPIYRNRHENLQHRLSRLNSKISKS
jgi:uncharacterized protein